MVMVRPFPCWLTHVSREIRRRNGAVGGLPQGSMQEMAEIIGRAARALRAKTAG